MTRIPFWIERLWAASRAPGASQTSQVYRDSCKPLYLTENKDATQVTVRQDENYSHNYIFICFTADDDCTVASVADTEETIMEDDIFESEVTSIALVCPQLVCAHGPISLITLITLFCARGPISLIPLVKMFCVQGHWYRCSSYFGLHQWNCYVHHWYR